MRRRALVLCIVCCAPFTAAARDGLCVTEIMYHPTVDGVEFLEIANLGDTAQSLSRAFFSEGIDFTFPFDTTIAPGERLVVTNSSADFAARYPGVTVAGEYFARLSNGGENLALFSFAGVELFRLRFDDAPPWPVAADGLGFSLTLADPLGDLNDPASWRASSVLGGTPGAEDLGAEFSTPIFVNEALTHTDPPLSDSIELFNPNDFAVDLRGWLLTDDLAFPAKARIPDDPQFILEANQYVYFSEDFFGFSPGSLNGELLPGFFLSSRGEEGVYIISADDAGTFTGWAHGFSFRGANNGESFGRHITSDGREVFVAQSVLSFGGQNVGPRVGPLVISEIVYAPAIGDIEYVEITNIGIESVSLFDDTPDGNPVNTYRLSGIGFGFEPGIVLPARASLLVVNTTPDLFRATYAVPEEVAVMGPFGTISADGMGALDNGGETLTLLKPDTPDGIIVPLIVVDAVTYDDDLPWPQLVVGDVLLRNDFAVYGNDPLAWVAGLPDFGNDLPEPPVLEVDTLFIDFGRVRINTTASDVVTLRNVGGETLEGSAVVAAPFTVDSPSNFTIPVDEGASLNVSFTPVVVGQALEVLEIAGGGGGSVTLAGEGFLEPATIFVTPEAFGYGAVRVGEALTQSFVVSNTGDGALEGNVQVPAPFGVVGESAYQIAGLSEQTIVIAFAPTEAGIVEGDAIFTGGEGASVSLIGEGLLEPASIHLSTSILEFAAIAVGDSRSGVVTVMNGGEARLEGAAATTAPFSVVEPSAYTLSAGESLEVTIAFNPTSVGTFDEVVTFTGGDGATLAVVAEALPLPAELTVDVDALDFETVTVGMLETLSFVASNVGGEELIGRATTTLPFAIIGSADYSIPPGETAELAVSFAPTDAVGYAQALSLTGGGGGSVELRGQGFLEPGQPAPNPDRLEFGATPLGETMTLAVMLENSGQALLEGAIQASPPFEIVGDSTFTITGGETDSFDIRFFPQAVGVVESTIRFTGGTGALVPATGEGVATICDAASDIQTQWNSFRDTFEVDDDTDNDGIPDAVSFMLADHGACQENGTLRDAIFDAYTMNIQSLSREEDYESLVAYRLSIATAMLLSETMQEAITQLLGDRAIVLAQTYATVRCNGNGCFSASPGISEAAETLAGDGDLDADGVTNADEYANVVAAGGNAAEFVDVAFDGNRDGRPVAEPTPGCSALARRPNSSNVSGNLSPLIAVIFLAAAGRKKGVG